MILNLDKQFYPFGIQNTIEYKSSVFPGGEPHIKILTDLSTVKHVKITHRVNCFNDFGLLLIAIDALKQLNVEYITVVIPYFPGARQDRVIAKGEALTVKVYTDILNTYHLKEVVVYDVHSDVAPALLNNSRIINNFSFIERVISELPKDNLVLISPDGGALKKIYKLAAHLKDFPVIECSKIRDLETGKLSHFNVYTNDLKNKNCLIIDDICDGGGTFIGLAKALKNKNANSLYLAISHGIFSKGFNHLNQYFKHIYTTNSFKSMPPSNTFTQFPIDMSHLSD